MKLEIISSDRDHAILIGDEDHNDIAEFYHSDHATVSQSYKTALALAKQLVEVVNGVAQQPWQPIETAPKDINVLMAWRYDGAWELASGWAGSTRGGWLHGQATHWQPLPAPPSNQGASK